MKTKEIVLGDKKFQLKEILYLDVIQLPKPDVDRKGYAVKLLTLSGLNQTEIDNLSASEGNFLFKEINELNGFVDFPKG